MVKHPRAIVGILAGLFTAFVLSACGGDDTSDAQTLPQGSALPRGSESVNLKPADFTTRIDNPYWPMAPGSRWVYRETDADGAELRVEVTATHKTKTIANGVEALVVHDLVTEQGQPVENTFD